MKTSEFTGIETKKARSFERAFENSGGERGIRTPGGREPTPDFKSGAFNRTLPSLRGLMRCVPQDEANDKEVKHACKAKI